MSQGPPPSGRQPDQSGDGVQYQQGPFQSPAQQRARNLYYRDPDTGRFLTDQEAAYVEQLARQHPRQVQQAYTQNVSFAAVGLPVPANLGDLGTQTGPQPQPPQPQQFSQQPQGYQQQTLPVNQQPVQGGQYQQPQQTAPEPQPSQVGENQEAVREPQQYQQPPQREAAEQSGGQVGGQTEQQLRTQPEGGQPVQRGPTEQPKQASSQQSDRTEDQSQGSHSAGGTSIPVERRGSDRAARIPLREADQQSRQSRHRQRGRQRRWFWWYNW